MPREKENVRAIFGTMSRLMAGAMLSVGFAIAGAIGQLTTFPEYRPRAWTLEQGLPDNSVRAILQTRDGYLWLATKAGLGRFDGIRFVVFNHNTHPEAFPNEACTALAETPDGGLWIGTENGLLRYVSGRFHRYTTETGLWANEITALCVTSNGDVWVGTRLGPNRLQGQRFKRFPPQQSTKASGDSATYVLHEDRSGALRIGSGAGLQHWDARQAIWRDDPVLINRSTFVRQIAEDSSGQIWLKGAFLWKPGDMAWNDAIEKQDWAMDIRCMASCRTGQFFLATREEGIVRWQNGQRARVEQGDAFRGVEVLCMYEDREANLWIGTETEGLIQWQPRSFRTLTVRDGLADDFVRTICETRDRGVWIGTERGLSRLAESTHTNEGSPPDAGHNGLQDPAGASTSSLRPGLRDAFKSAVVRTLFEDSGGGLWLGTVLGVACYRDGAFREYRLPGGDMANSIRVICGDKSGSLWFGSAGGLHRLSDDTVVTYTTADGLPRDDIRALAQDSTGTLWVGTVHGLSRVSPPGTADAAARALGPVLQASGEVASISPKSRPLAWLNYSVSDGLPDDSISVLYQGSEQTLWIGTSHGFGFFKSGSFFAFTKEQGLSTAPVNAILEDDLGYVWVGFERGITRVWKQELFDVATGKRGSVRTWSFDETDGLVSSRVNGQRCQPAACKTSDGRLWFATTRGVAVVDPKYLQENLVQPPVLIEELRANEQVVFSDGIARRGTRHGRSGPEIVLQPGSATVLEFQCTANSLRVPNKVRFKYRLEGRETSWHDAGMGRSPRYTNLKPGPYRFHVMASNNHGLWNERGASLAVYVAPYFYQTAWFYSFGALAAAGVVWGFHFWRVRSLARIHSLQQQNALLRERERIANDLHDDVGAELTEIVLMSELARSRELSAGRREPLFARISETSAALVDKLSDLISDMHPQAQTLPAFSGHFREWIAKALEPTQLQGHFDFPRTIPDRWMDAGVARHLGLIGKEAVNNAIKHSGGTRLNVSLKLCVDELQIKIADNGRGILVNSASGVGRGLPSMRERAKRIGGALELSSQPGLGTTVQITVLVPTGRS